MYLQGSTGTMNEYVKQLEAAIGKKLEVTYTSAEQLEKEIAGAWKGERGGVGG